MASDVIMIKAGDRVRLKAGSAPLPVPQYLDGTWATVIRFSGYASVFVETDVPQTRNVGTPYRKIRLGSIDAVDRDGTAEPVPWHKTGG